MRSFCVPAVPSFHPSCRPGPALFAWRTSVSVPAPSFPHAPCPAFPVSRAFRPLWPPLFCLCLHRLVCVAHLCGRRSMRVPVCVARRVPLLCAPSRTFSTSDLASSFVRRTSVCVLTPAVPASSMPCPSCIDALFLHPLSVLCRMAPPSLLICTTYRGPALMRFAAGCAASARSEATKRRKDGISRPLRLFYANRAYKVMLSGKNGLPLPNPCLDRLSHGMIRASGLHYLCRV